MKISSFSKTYGNRTVLDFPGFDFERGKVYAVLGANGSGKSTFAKITAGIITADRKGDVLPDGIRAGYLPQSSYTFTLSVGKNVLLNTGDVEAARKIADRLGLSPLYGKNARKLSGGEKAKTALARLLVKKYDVIILDEPTASMDMESTTAAESLITGYAEANGAAVIIITHSVSQAQRIADEVLYLRNGLLEYSGKNPEVFENPGNENFRKHLGFFR